MYFKQIDTLRAFAVILVIYSHWGSQNSIINQLFPVGFFGVNIFFVISGFLITQILLSHKNQINSKSKVIKSFFLRRTLRIFPLYYATLFFLWVINYPGLRENFLPYLFYYCNIDYYWDNEMHGILSPRWSLAVEEQFYLIWPFLILFISKIRLKIFFIAVILFAFLLRSYLTVVYPEKELVQFLMTSNLDSLAGGGLLAYFYKYDMLKFTYIANKKRVLAILLVGVILLILNSFYFYNKIFTGILPVNLKAIGCTLISLSLVVMAIKGYRGFLGKLMSNKVLIYIGKISYGLYLYHSLIFLIMRRVGINITNPMLKNTIGFMLLLLISSASWYFFEKPINNLKKYFSYRYD